MAVVLVAVGVLIVLLLAVALCLAAASADRALQRSQQSRASEDSEPRIHVA